MRTYETLIMFSPDTTDEQVTGHVDRTSSIITDEDGTVRHVDNWGLRELAFEIEDKTTAKYVCITHDASPSAVSELERQLYLSDDVFRYKTLRIPEHVAAAAGTVSMAAPALVGEESDEGDE